jgi:hypothetical protein
MQPCRNQRTARKGAPPERAQEPEERYACIPKSRSLSSADRLFEMAQRIILTRRLSLAGEGRVGRMSPVIERVARASDLGVTGAASVGARLGGVRRREKG